MDQLLPGGLDVSRIPVIADEEDLQADVIVARRVRIVVVKLEVDKSD
jgi:hypothetical protein